MLSKVTKHYDYKIDPLTKSKKITKEEWVKRAEEKHGGEFDYSKVVYIDSKSKVEIICKKHGSFWQNPNSHINRGDKCPKCSQEKKADMNRTSLSDFITKCSEIHNNKFDYSLVHNYKSLEEKLSIICPKHGVFEVVGYSHLLGHDCEKCSYEKRAVNARISKEDMLLRLNSFNNGLTYDLSNYVNTGSKIYYYCPVHGKVGQRVSKHLRGKNCKKCNKSTSWNTSNTKDFIEKAVVIHNNYYNYDKTVYERNSKKVIITCPHHGDFQQRPNNHLLGAGCNVCSNITSNFKDAEKHEIEESKSIGCYLYLMYFPKENFYKIGISRNLKNRIKGIKGDSKAFYSPNIEYCIKISLFEAATIESELHLKYIEYRYKPKTNFKGRTECFTIDLPINEIKQYLKQVEADYKIGKNYAEVH